MIHVTKDLSPAFGPVRDQGQRPTCLAFAGSDLHAHAHGSAHLSVDYLSYYTAAAMASLWQPGMGFSVDHLLQAVNAPGQPPELAYPYHPSDQERPLTAPPNVNGLRKMPSRHPVLSPSNIASAIQNGDAVGIVIAVTPSLHNPQNGVVQYETAVFPDQFHAMAIVGLGSNSLDGLRYYLARNSWGPTWGQGGHAWIPESHLFHHTTRVFMI